MPTYNYMCENCKHEFEELLKLAERELPCQNRCPACHKLGVEQIIKSTAVVADTTRLNFEKRTDSRLKERLQQIKSKFPGSTIKV